MIIPYEVTLTIPSEEIYELDAEGFLKPAIVGSAIVPCQISDYSGVVIPINCTLPINDEFNLEYMGD